MPDVSPGAEKSSATTSEGQAVSKVNPVLAPGAAAEKRQNFIYNILHRKKKTDTAKSAVPEPVSPPAVAAAERVEPALERPLTPDEIRKAELGKRITEAGKDGRLGVALEGRLEDWHTQISDWLIKVQGVPDPMSMRESLSRFGQLVMDPDLQVEDSKRQGAEMARDVLGVADKLVTSIRLRLGGPYSKGGQNGSDN